MFYAGVVFFGGVVTSTRELVFILVTLRELSSGAVTSIRELAFLPVELFYCFLGSVTPVGLFSSISVAHSYQLY